MRIRRRKKREKKEKETKKSILGLHAMLNFNLYVWTGKRNKNRRKIFGPSAGLPLLISFKPYRDKTEHN